MHRKVGPARSHTGSLVSSSKCAKLFVTIVPLLMSIAAFVNACHVYYGVSCSQNVQHEPRHPAPPLCEIAWTDSKQAEQANGERGEGLCLHREV